MNEIERSPHEFKGGWFYVDRKKCSFHSENNNHVHDVPTKLIRSWLAKMDKMISDQKRARKGTPDAK